MVQKIKRNPKRTDQEWLDLIQECRTSGMTDKEWCDRHHIQRSNFYYHVRRLRAKAVAIPESCVPSIQSKQEVVPVPVLESLKAHAPVMGNTLDSASETAIRLIFHGFQMEITNAAASETITNTIAALQRMC